MRSETAPLSERLTAGHTLLGTFVKTASPQTVEVLGTTELDFLVIDAEHAPYDRVILDQMLMAARAAAITVLVRTPHTDAAMLQGALDGGAAGVVVPHVQSAADARRVVAQCRYQGGTRGYSGWTRSNGFGGGSLSENILRADQGVAVIAQIEDETAVGDIDAILAVDGLAGVFIGRADLAVSMGSSSPSSDEVMSAVRTIARASKRHGLPVLLFAATWAEAQSLLDLDSNAFVISSDQGLMRAHADALTARWATSVQIAGDHSGAETEI